MSGLEKTCRVALAVGLALAAYGTMHGRAQANDCNDAPALVAIARAPAVIGLPVVKRRVHHKTVFVATAKIEIGCMDLEPKFSPVGLPPIADEDLPPEYGEPAPNANPIPEDDYTIGSGATYGGGGGYVSVGGGSSGYNVPTFAPGKHYGHGSGRGGSGLPWDGWHYKRIIAGIVGLLLGGIYLASRKGVKS